jgi:hypothetical protein
VEGEAGSGAGVKDSDRIARLTGLADAMRALMDAGDGVPSAMFQEWRALLTTNEVENFRDLQVARCCSMLAVIRDGADAKLYEVPHA